MTQTVTDDLADVTGALHREAVADTTVRGKSHLMGVARRAV